MSRVVLLLVCASGVLRGQLLKPSSAWQPTQYFVADIHRICDGKPAFADCVAQQMQRGGASADATAFTKSRKGEAFVRGLREVGRVAVAYVRYLFRTGDNDVVLLVNGNPAVIDVDDTSRLPMDLVKQVLPNSANAMLFPADRSDIDQPLEVDISNSGQLFVVKYNVNAGCRTCPLLAYAYYGFHFNILGHFEGVSLLGVQKDGPIPVRVPPTSDFTIVMPSNRAAGYVWQDTSVGKSESLWHVGSHYRSYGSQLPGASGVALFNYRSASRGVAELSYEYGQPWVAVKKADKTAHLKVQVQ